jgi:AcrR family transcriptional regulator
LIDATLCGPDSRTEIDFQGIRSVSEAMSTGWQPSKDNGPEPDQQDSGRQRLLEAAEELFATKGYAATTTREISDHAGLSRGLLYYHFPSKEALFNALIKERTPLGTIDGFLEQYPDDPRSALIAIGTSGSTILTQRGQVFRAILRGGPNEDEALSLIQQRARPTLAKLGEYLVTTIGEDRISRRQAQTIAQTFASALLVANVLLPPADPSAYIEDLVDVLLRAYV